ncbi:MAG: Thiosulfate sulfurtransferase GlpE [Myxococcota bacterium]|nr:Thiosulfate sulfurtransferase GlpE [Myxococcota bacterium]
MSVSSQELISRARKAVREVTADQVHELVPKAEHGEVVIIDVREKDERRAGFIPHSVHIARGFLELRIEEHVPARDKHVVLYCAGGNRSALAAQSLALMGYTNVSSLDTGFNGWKRHNLPIAQERELSADQRDRYSRHIMLPEVGETGQKKLLDAKVLLVGAGGLGSPAALYLAAAGVGTLGVIDPDVVDASNLQRQILHSTDMINVPKVESAAKRLKGLNPDVNIIPYQDRLSSQNVMGIFEKFDIVVDGTDNFPTRYLINDACVMLGKPNVHGSIFRFEGQATVYNYQDGPCYRCLYPEPPPPGMVPSCSEAGVLGVLPGIVGSIQAMEAIKIILGKGNVLSGRLLMFDALNMKFREMKLRRDAHCKVCGDNPEIRELIDYEQFCAIAA